MRKTLYLMFSMAVVVMASSCKKDSPQPAPPPTPAPTINRLATLGLYQYQQPSTTDRRIFIIVSGVGTKVVNYPSVFDTGSTGMTIDANGIIPASMITSSGIAFTGDSVNIYGITITSKKDTMAYGNQTSSTKEYGYVAYAPITIGDQNGGLTTNRIPIFLYYKVVSTTNGSSVVQPAHSADIFGVGPGTSYASNLIASPLSYLDYGTSVTNGFRLAMLNSANFTASTNTATYVAGLLMLGLLPADLSSSSGFIMHPFGTSSSTTYTAEIPGTITYNNTKVTGATFLFDTGTPSITIIENPLATTGIGPLPTNTTVTLTTNKGFVYTYNTTNTTNLTSVANPYDTGDLRTVFSLDFFASNEFLTDYTDHEIGLKNN